MKAPERRFWFRLALALGMSIRQVQQNVDSAEFSEWIAYCNIEPFGEERADLRSAIVASTIANCNRKANKQAFKVSDFMPMFKRSPIQKSWKSMKAMLSPLAKSFGKNK